MSETQQEQLRDVLNLNPTALLVLAMDNDTRNKQGQEIPFEQRPGEQMAQRVAAMAPKGMSIERHTPSAKD